MIRKLAENVLMMGNQYFNYLMIGKEKAVIIECGVSAGVMSFQQDWQQLPRFPEIKTIVAMHEHFDHVCGIPGLRAMFPGVPIMAHTKAGRVLNKAAVVKGHFQQDEKMSILLQNWGIIKDQPPTPQLNSILIDEYVAEGDIIPVHGVGDLKVMETPGHSPGSLALYLKEEQLMCLSDAGGYQIRNDFIFPIFFQGYEMYLESLERMSTYPTHILFLPHGEIWTGESVHLFYRRALESAEKAFNCIRRLLNEGLAGEEIEQRLYKHYYRDGLTIYTPDNIRLCVKLLVQRTQECL
ncbi:MAG: MBL fold metallo-hydrolase [Syntrophomonadaceae bacterium]|jgi:glyoxylase-like metal-dependent hydrolase (beta-lactamase superfamily II)|nr:MBL fold metallo-hydrolase [Syntrophomonadaceae bacterium]